MVAMSRRTHAITPNHTHEHKHARTHTHRHTQKYLRTLANAQNVAHSQTPSLPPPLPPSLLPTLFPPLVPSGWTPWSRAFVPSLKKSRHTFERRDFGGRGSPSVFSWPLQPAGRRHRRLGCHTEETQTLPGTAFPEQAGAPLNSREGITESQPGLKAVCMEAMRTFTGGVLLPLVSTAATSEAWTGSIACAPAKYPQAPGRPRPPASRRAKSPNTNPSLAPTSAV